MWQHSHLDDCSGSNGSIHTTLSSPINPNGRSISDGRIRQVYQIIYQVIKCKYNIVSSWIFASSKQFAILILFDDIIIKELRVRDCNFYQFAIFRYLPQFKMSWNMRTYTTTKYGKYSPPLIALLTVKRCIQKHGGFRQHFL